MKKLFLILLIAPLFWGCEKYEMISEPSISGRWIFTDYQIVKISSISPIDIIKTDTICINAFNNQSFVSGGIIMKQNYNQTSPDRRFVIGDIWEFDGAPQATSYDLYVTNNTRSDQLKADFPRPYLANEYSDLYVKNLTTGSYTSYTFSTDAMGSLAKKLTLTSTPITTDLYLSTGMRDKAVTVMVILRFTRR
jgi:hypothetical protein